MYVFSKVCLHINHKLFKMCGVAPIVNTLQVGSIWKDNSFGKSVILLIKKSKFSQS